MKVKGRVPGGAETDGSDFGPIERWDNCIYIRIYSSSVLDGFVCIINTKNGYQ